MSPKSLLSADNIAYRLSSDKMLFKGVNLGINNGDRIALVGCNGIGKSTLLKILSNQIVPTSGNLNCNVSTYYLPQISTLLKDHKEDTIYEYLSSVLDEWWEIINILEIQLGTSLDISIPIKNLSGGEITKLFLAIGIYKQSDIILLDEPTNHLDFLSLEYLTKFLNNFNGAFIIVSHQPFFLDRVANTTWELTSNGINIYGGNFSFYKKEKEIELQNALKTREIAKKELARTKESALKEEKRAARSQREGKITASKGGMGKGERKGLASLASASSGSASQKHNEAVNKALEKLSNSKVTTKKLTNIRLDTTNNKRGKNIIEIERSNLKIGGELFLNEINIYISLGDRVAISGANGSGKSSLIKAILNSLSGEKSNFVIEGGRISISQNMNIVYLDQKYNLIDNEKTVLENMYQANKSFDYEFLRQQLGDFLFKNHEVDKNASVLSGGELARLSLAIISISEIDLLILDEPTNNLDLETVEQIVDALEGYEGTILVISHDLDFLSKINIEKSFQIKNKRLEPTFYLPKSKEMFYQELIL